MSSGVVSRAASGPPPVISGATIRCLRAPRAVLGREPPVTVVVLVRACQGDMSFGPVEMFADDVADLVIGDGTGPEVVGRRPLTFGMLDSGDTPRA